jgi:hypothetical protein
MPHTTSGMIAVHRGPSGYQSCCIQRLWHVKRHHRYLDGILVAAEVEQGLVEVGRIHHEHSGTLAGHHLRGREQRMTLLIGLSHACPKVTN